MSENQVGQRSYAPEYQLDPRLYDGPHNPFSSNEVGRQQHLDQGQRQILPPISPYSTKIFPREASLNNNYPSETRSYSPYEEQQYEQVFTDPEQARSQGPPPINDSSLQLDSSRAEYMSLSDQHRLRQFNNGGVADYCANLAPVNPVCFCPICGARYANKEEIRSHFRACVARNGNPYGVYFDDGPGTRRAARPLSERARKRSERLDSVNRVVVPSKLAVGEPPWISPNQSSASSTLNFACPLCKVPFGRVDHIRSHFPACVDHNGNPDGLRWDDGLPVLKRGPKAVKG